MSQLIKFVGIIFSVIILVSHNLYGTKNPIILNIKSNDILNKTNHDLLLASKQIYQELIEEYKEIIQICFDINKIANDDSKISNFIKQKTQQKNWWVFKIYRYCNSIENSINILTALKNKLPEEENFLRNQMQTLIVKLNETKTYIMNSYEYRREKGNYAISKLIIILGVIYGIYYFIKYDSFQTTSEVDQRLGSKEYLLGAFALLMSS